MPSDDVLCVIQARMGSTRLPGKVLAEVAGRPMLAFQLERLLADPPGRVIVATSDLSRDDPIADAASSMGVVVVRGSETDVLERFMTALDVSPAEHVVRLTADCPLTDPSIVGAVVHHHELSGADYTSNTLPRTFPKGLDVEVARVESLRAAAAEAVRPGDREHVMPYLYRHPERFRLANVRSGSDLGNEWWTVDTNDDLAFVRWLASRFDSPIFGWKEALSEAGVRATPSPAAVHLRPAVDTDSERVLEWRNDPASIAASEDRRAIDPDHHARWFARVLDDPGCRLWIAERDGQPIGTVRIDVADACGTISLIVAPGARRQGLARQFLAAMQAELVGVQQVDTVVSRVRRDNAASRAAFSSVGFADLERNDSDSNDIVRLGWAT